MPIDNWKARNAAEKALRREQPAKPIASLTVRPNTFKWLCLAYMDTDAFKGLDETTRTKRRQIIESMWEERLHPLDETDARTFAQMPLSAMDAQNIVSAIFRSCRWMRLGRLVSIMEVMDTSAMLPSHHGAT